MAFLLSIPSFSDVISFYSSFKSLLQGDLFIVRCEDYRSICGILLLQPLDQTIVPIGQNRQNGSHENGIAQHGWYGPYFPAFKPIEGNKQPLPQVYQEESHQHHPQDNVNGIQDASLPLRIPFDFGEEKG